MNKNRLMLLLVVLLITFILVETVGIVFPLYSSNLYLAGELSTTKDEIVQLNSEVDSLKTKIIELNMTIKECKEQSRLIEELNAQIESLNVTIKEMTESAEMAENETNNLMSMVVLGYVSALNQVSYHLTAIWEDKDKDIWVRNYKVNGALYHLEHIMWLIKHAYWLVKLYSNCSEFFQLLSGIICNNTFGDIISALQLVYGHIYAFNISLGTHQIDVDLLAGCANYIPKICKILSKVEINGIPPRNQISDQDYHNLQLYFQELNRIVSEYLQKPGTDIS